MVKITCNKCGKQLSIDETKLPMKEVKFPCPQCKADQFFDRTKMDDERIETRTTLDREDSRDGTVAGGVGSKAVNCLGRHADGLAGSKRLRGGNQAGLTRVPVVHIENQRQWRTKRVIALRDPAARRVLSA